MKHNYFTQGFAALAVAFAGTAMAQEAQLPAFTASPEEGVVESLKRIELIFAEGSVVTENDTVVNTTTLADSLRNKRVIPSVDANKYIVDVIEELPNATYTLTVPANTFLVDGVAYSDSIRLEYQLLEPAFDKWTVSPEPGIVNELNEITVKFTIGTVTEVGFGTTLNDGTRGYRLGTGILHNDYVITVREDLPDGSYTLTIPAGTLALDGEPFDEEISFAYELVDGTPANFTVTPEQGVVDSLTEVVLTFPDATTVTEVGYNTSLIGAGEAADLLRVRPSVEGNTYKIEVVETPAPGEYILTIPAGTLAFDSVVYNKSIVLKYEVAEVLPAYTINPAGPVVEELTEIKVTFPGAQVIKELAYDTQLIGDEVVPVRLSVEGDSYIVTVKPEYVDGVPQPLAEGFYALSIPANTLEIDGVVYTKAIVANYQLQAAPNAFYSVNPANDSMVETLDEIVLTFDGATEITEDFNYAVVLTDYKEGFRVSTAVDGNQFKITPVEQLPAGPVQITIPAGALVIDGVPTNREIVLGYTITGVVLPDYTISPAGGEVPNLNKVVVTFPNAEEIAELNQAITLSNGQEGFRLITSVSGNELTIKCPETLVDGTYTLTIPAGTIVLDGMPWQSDIVAEYTVNAALIPAYTLSPAQGAVEALTEVVLTFAEDAVVTELAYNTTLSNADEKFRVLPSVDGNAYKVQVIELLASGNYTVNIPAGTIAVNGEAIDFDIDLEYFVIPTPLPAMEVNPAAGYVSELKEIVVTFTESTEVKELGYGTRLNDGEQSFNIYPSAKGNQYTVIVREDVPYGAYNLEIPANTLEIDGVAYNQPIVFTFFYQAAQNVEYTITPEDGANVEALTEIVVNFTGATEVTEIGMGTTLATEQEAVRIFTSVEGADYKIQVLETVGDDTYFLTIPAMTVSVDGVANAQAIVAAFHLVKGGESAVTIITPDADGNFNIFNLNGQRVNTNNPAELRKGIYVINGVKVVVK